MTRPPQFSHRFVWIALAMAVPLIAILAYVAYDRYVKDDGAGDGWQTYRNERFKFEIRFPPDWHVEYQLEMSGLSKPGVPGISVRFADPQHPSQSGEALHADVRINWASDWCVSSAPLMDTREVTLDGLKGSESVCYWRPGLPFSVLRDFHKNDDRVWVIGEVAPYTATASADYPVALKIVQSFRFTD